MIKAKIKTKFLPLTHWSQPRSRAEGKLIPFSLLGQSSRKRGLIFIFLFFLLIGGQIFFSNRLAVRGEEIEYYQQKLAALEKEKERLEHEINQTASLQYIEKKARERLEMKKVEEVIYLTPEHFAARLP